MEIKDLFITPIFLLIFYAIAYWLRPKLTDAKTRKYFIPALTVKFIGAIALGLIYQFYYGGGDTFNYFHDAKIIADSFYDSPFKYFKIFFSNGEYDGDTFSYTNRLFWFRAKTEFTVSRITSIFCLFTFSTYSAVALFFAFFSFFGLWLMYNTFVKIYNNFHKEFATAIFFMPSVFFWGSGVMKDTIAIGIIGFLFFGFYRIFIEKKSVVLISLLFIVSIFLIKNIRIYILLAFIPPAIIWVFLENIIKVKNTFLRFVIFPFAIVLGTGIAVYVAQNVTAGDARYDLENIGAYTKINAEYLYRISVKSGGSAYYLGDLDGTFLGTIRLAPAAIYTTLFRPFLWEVKNIVMLLSSLESLLILIGTIFVVFKVGFFSFFRKIIQNPSILLSFLFSIVFSFAVGITSYNFGTLVRYKIPAIPFYLCTLIVVYYSMKVKGSHKH